MCLIARSARREPGRAMRGERPGEGVIPLKLLKANCSPIISSGSLFWGGPRICRVIALTHAVCNLARYSVPSQDRSIKLNYP